MIRSSLISLLLCTASPALASDLVPLPVQADDIAWPMPDWSTASLSQDQQSKLDARLDPVFATEIGEGLGETRGVVVIKNGAMVQARYRDGVTPETRHVSWSVAKSVTQALVGRAVMTGLIESIDDSMPAAFDDGDPRGKISWRHWLQMLDGLDYAEYGVPGLENDATQMLYGPGRYDVAAHVREHFPLAHSPGEHWNYSTATFHLIARALQAKLPGTCLTAGENPRTCKANPEVMSDWVDQALFGPLGLDAVEEYDAAGTMLGGSNVYMSAEDYAKFGLLFLRDGMWGSERLLPEGWVDFARTNPDSSDDNGYGGGFWPSPENPDNSEINFTAPFDAFHAGGREGQIIWIIPSRDLVFVRVGLMSDTAENWNALFQLGQDIGAILDRP